MIKRLLSSRRGVSTVVAEMMMIVITVVAFALTFTVTNRWLSMQRANEMEVIRERLIIENAWFLPSPNSDTVRLVVTNVGRIDLKVQFIHVEGARRWPATEGELLEVNRGVSRSLDVPLGGAWTVDRRYEIRLITDRGNQFEAVFWSPSG